MKRHLSRRMRTSTGAWGLKLKVFFGSQALFALKTAVGIAFAPALGYIDRYAQKGVPEKDWEAPRYRYWHNGEEIHVGTHID